MRFAAALTLRAEIQIKAIVANAEIAIGFANHIGQFVEILVFGVNNRYRLHFIALQ